MRLVLPWRQSARPVVLRLGQLVRARGSLRMAESAGASIGGGASPRCGAGNAGIGREPRKTMRAVLATCKAMDCLRANANGAVVMDVFARRIVGWSIADHLRLELVVDALDTARWRRKPKAGNTIVHSDHGTQYTGWAFGQRLRQAGLLGSMGSIGDCYDNSMIESFFGSMQLELLDRWQWATRQELANAIFGWIESWSTRSGAIQPLATCPQSTTNDTTPPTPSRREHHTETVRRIG